MGKAIVTINEIIELNQLLKEEDLPFKVHLHDACGNQSFSIEAFLDNKEDEAVCKLNDTIIDYFNNIGMELQFSADQLSFQVIAKN